MRCVSSVKLELKKQKKKKKKEKGAHSEYEVRHVGTGMLPSLIF